MELKQPHLERFATKKLFIGSGNCTCYINYKGGKMFLTSGEVGLDSNGDITITGG